MADFTSISHQPLSFSLTLPSRSLLNVFRSENPAPVSPPIRGRSLTYPFSIDSQVYHNALSIFWPIIIASLYGVVITWWNRLNVKRNHRPWGFSQTNAFFWLVIAHNVFLAIYSGWTFIGMSRAVSHSFSGWRSQYGIAGALDSLCKIHGPRGQGSAATYDPASGTWSNLDLTMRLQGGLPDSTDVGRIWNEGLAYYGWLFYLSKFYEVVDTFIILTKGKKTSFLQSYHHAGAMFAMWAGIRYMSPPIWLFTCINSFIHTWMYTYYIFVAFQIGVPAKVKQSLTTAQIAQIISGAIYALAHLFIAYDVPANTPYRVFDSLSTALPGAYSSATSFVASATSPANIGGLLKKAALRAAGEGGLAANVRNAEGKAFGLDAINLADASRSQEQIVYRLGTTRVHCLDTSGQVFAIILNLFYLVPLAVLFISFFAGYFRQDHCSKRESAEKAAKNVAGEVVKAMGDQQGGATVPPEDLKAKVEDAKAKVKDVKDSAQNKAQDVKQTAQRNLHNAGPKVKQAANDVKDKAKQATDTVTDKASEISAAMQDSLRDTKKNTEKGASGKDDEKSGEGAQKAEKADDELKNVKIEENLKDEKKSQPNGV